MYYNCLAWLEIKCKLSLMEDEDVYKEIVSKLMLIFESEALAESWLSTPNEELANNTPMEYIKEGKPKEVLKFIESLEGRHLVH